MNRIFYLLSFLLLGCSVNKCLENNEAYSRFLELHNVDDNLLPVSNKEEVAEYKREINSIRKIFSRICNKLEGNKRLLFLDELSVAWGRKRIGLVYLYEKDLLFYFNEENSRVTVGQGYNNYNDLKKTLDIVKPDFYRKANRLKKYFSKQSMDDVPFLQLAYIDLSKAKDADSLIGFSFGGVIDEKLKEIKE